jgi:hypothetical protein
VALQQGGLTKVLPVRYLRIKLAYDIHLQGECMRIVCTANLHASSTVTSEISGLCHALMLHILCSTWICVSILQQILTLRIMTQSRNMSQCWRFE